MRARGVLLGVLLIVGITSNARQPFGLGADCPTWTNLPGADGKRHSLADFQKHKGLLLVFYANHCPDCGLYLDRLKKLALDYRDQGIATVFVSVSNKEEDKLPAMSKLVEEKKLPIVYVHDASQKLGKELEAEWTPEAYLFDGDRRLIYHGGIDDHWNAEKVKRQYLREAIEDLLAGRKVAKPITEPHGCVIDYDE